KEMLVVKELFRDRKVKEFAWCLVIGGGIGFFGMTGVLYSIKPASLSWGKILLLTPGAVVGLLFIFVTGLWVQGSLPIKRHQR
ncbi:MAG: hypothetical protein AAB915_00845, partial [Patescibacteria group bacterium]